MSASSSPDRDYPRGPTRPTREIVEIGREIYHRDILPLIRETHDEEYVMIDTETGNWAVAPTEDEARQTLKKKHPEAINILCERVGYRTPLSMGGGSQRITE